jgi:hypothetical protein
MSDYNARTKPELLRKRITELHNILYQTEGDDPDRDYLVVERNRLLNLLINNEKGK